MSAEHAQIKIPAQVVGIQVLKFQLVNAPARLKM